MEKLTTFQTKSGELVLKTDYREWAVQRAINKAARLGYTTLISITNKDDRAEVYDYTELLKRKIQTI